MASFARKMAALPASSWASMVAALPVVLWCHDSFYSICRVQGSSMEPTLSAGDIVLVRKSDGVWRRCLSGWKNDQEDQDLTRTLEKHRLEDWERRHCNATTRSWFLRKPPVVLTGDLVVYQDPSEYLSGGRTSWNIKRVVGLGGQVVMLPISHFAAGSNNSSRSSWRMDDKLDQDGSSRMRLATPQVPPYSLWLVGDNVEKSHDSRQHGPISKKLLVGIAEYRIWPPTRLGKLNSCESMETGDMNATHQSYWP